MSIAIGDIVSGGTAGSVLFIDASGGNNVLAQDNSDFYYDPAINTLKSKDQAAAATSNFAISTGDVTGTTGAGSGTVTIDTGNGSTAVSSGAGGNSGNATITTGSGGGASSGAAGKSGDLLLKTGSGGASSTGAAGNSGSIIIQPGSLGSGIGGTSGSTLVRAPTTATSDILAVQSADGATNHWAVASGGQLNGTNALQFTHTTTNASINTLFVNGAGAKNDNFTAMNTGSTATSSTASVTKTALSVQSTGTWNGTNAINRALYVNATGGAKNLAAIFEAGNVGINVTDPSARLHIAAGTAGVGGAALKFTSGALLTTPEAGTLEWDGSEFYRTNATARRPLGTSLEVANVLDFGAKGDNSTDDSAAVQAAVDAVTPTGGVVYFPPGRAYILGGITITSKYPIWLVSEMDGHQIGGTSTNAYHDRATIRPKSGSAFMFKWLKHAAYDVGWGAGGGIRGLCIDDSGPSIWRNVSLDAAIDVDDASIWKAINCVFSWIKGRAIKFGSTIYGQVLDCKFLGCGDAPRTGRLGITGTLTARTDNDTGEITFSANHGIITGDRLDIYWTISNVNYSRRGVIVGTVSGNVVPIDGGAGDALPAVSTSGISEAIRERAGTLTTRTDDNTGQVTLATGHGIVSGDIIDVLWTISNVSYRRRGVVVGTVSGNIVPIDGGLGDALPAASTAVTITSPLLPTIGIGEIAHPAPMNFSFAWLRNVFIESTFWATAIKVSDVGGGGLNISNGYFENGFSDDVDNTFIDAGFGGLAVDSCSFNAIKGDHEAITASSDNATIHNSHFDNGNRTVPNIAIAGGQCRLSNLRISGGGGTKSITISGLYCALSDIYLYFNGTLDVSASLFSALSNIYVLTSSVPSGAYAIDLGDYNSLDHAVLRGPGFSSRAAGGVIRAGISKISDASIYYFNETGVKTTAAGSQVLGCKVAEVTTLFDLATGTIASGNYPWADGLVYSNSAASSAVSNTTVETDFDKTYAIDASRLRAGTVIRIRGMAFVTGATGGGTIQLRLKIGSIVVQDTGAVTAGSSFLGYFDSTLIVRVIGTSGTIIGSTVWGLGTYNAVTPLIGFLGAATINTTTSQTVKLSAQWSVANAGNSVRLDIFAVEILKGASVG